MQSLSNTNIANIWTRIFYQNHVLKYEISIQLINGTSNVFQVFTNYEKYRLSLDELVKAKNNKEHFDLVTWAKRA